MAVVLSLELPRIPSVRFSAAMRIASLAASRSASDSGTPGSASWISATIDGVASFGVCSFSVIAKDSSGSRAVASSSATSASPIVASDNNMASNGNIVCPGWSGFDQPRPGHFDSTAAAPVTSPTSTRSRPSCRAAVLGQRLSALPAFVRIRSCSQLSTASQRTNRIVVGAACHAASSRS